MPKLFDLHTHTKYSDGQGEIKDNIQRAFEQGLDLVAITDHFGEPLPYRLGVAQFLEQAEEIKKLAPHPVKVVHGIEAGIETVLPEEMLGKVDVIIRSIHYFRKTPPKPKGLFDEVYWEFYKNEVLDLMQTQPTDVVGHIEGYLPLPLDGAETTFAERRELERDVAKRFFNIDWQRKVAQLAVENNIAMEIHSSSKTPRIDFLALCARAGTLFSVSTDAHTPDAIDKVDWGFEVVRELKIPKKQLLPYYKGWLS